jgi:hypothetical protein
MWGPMFSPDALRIDTAQVASQMEQTLRSQHNMAAIAVLSTQLVHHHFIKHRPAGGALPPFRKVVDRVTVPEPAL